HPRIPPGPFEVVWTGLLLFQDADVITIDRVVGGDAKVFIAGSEVAGPLELKPGFHPIRIEYRSKNGVRARFQLGWEGKTFAREPIPAWKFRHPAADETDAVRQEIGVQRGRERVAQLGCARCHLSAFPGSTETPP